MRVSLHRVAKTNPQGPVPNWSFAIPLLLLVAAGAAFGHAAPEVINEQINEEIEAAGGLSKADGQLILQRAESYRQDADYEAALADYALAEDAGLGADVAYYRARMYLEAGEPEKAVSEAKRFLKYHPGNSYAQVTLAYAYADSGDYPAAVEAMEQGLVKHPLPTADHYLKLADWNLESGNTEQAIAALNAGNKRLSPQVSLISRAVDILEQSGDYSGAIKQINTLPSGLTTQPGWQLRLGDLQRKAGDSEAALVSYRKAAAALDAMSELKRSQLAIIELQQIVTIRLNELDESSSE